MSEREALVRKILLGIDETENESEHGWWETSFGAEFGKNKLEELIAALTAQQEQVNAEGSEFGPVTEAELDAARVALKLTRITAALEEKDDGWIKCSERLPEDAKSVLVVYRGYVEKTCFYGNHWLLPSSEQPTHWRPLPPLPKGDE